MVQCAIVFQKAVAIPRLFSRAFLPVCHELSSVILGKSAGKSRASVPVILLEYPIVLCAPLNAKLLFAKRQLLFCTIM